MHYEFYTPFVLDLIPEKFSKFHENLTYHPNHLAQFYVPPSIFIAYSLNVAFCKYIVVPSMARSILHSRNLRKLLSPNPHWIYYKWWMEYDGISLSPTFSWWRYKPDFELPWLIITINIIYRYVCFKIFY